MKLEPGTVRALYNSQKNNPLYRSPVLQVTSLGKIMASDSEKHRYTANASDGTYYMKAVFSSMLSSLIDDGHIQCFHILRLEQFTVRMKENNNYLYIQSILESEAATAIVGRPVNISTGRPSMEAAGAAQAPAAKGAEAPAVSIRRAREDSEGAKRSKDGADAAYTDIRDINPFQSRWTIKGRVMSKSDIRRFTSQRGEGKLFSFELADRTAQVKCVAFSECVDIFFPLVEVNKVLTLTNATIKMANKKYSAGGLDYEIQLEKGTEVQQVVDESIPQYSFKFVKIRDLSVGQALVDVAVVVREAYPAGSVTVRSTGKELAKRDLLVVDETGSCRVTLWGARAEEEYEPGSVLCLKAVRVGEYNGINLSTLATSQVVVDCDVPEAVEVLAWYQAEGKDVVLERPRRQVQRQLIGTVKDADVEYATVQGAIMHIKEDGIYYEACPGDGCNKKVTPEDSGSYRCEKCNYTYPNCSYRYMLTMNVGDFTGQVWVSMFDDAARGLLGMSAQQLKEMGDESPQDLQGLLRGMVAREVTMRVRIRDEVYNGEPKKRFNCLECTRVDHASEARRMLDAIEHARA